jgi:hypothetical protein
MHIPVKDVDKDDIVNFFKKRTWLRAMLNRDGESEDQGYKRILKNPDNVARWPIAYRACIVGFINGWLQAKE